MKQMPGKLNLGLATKKSLFSNIVTNQRENKGIKNATSDRLYNIQQFMPDTNTPIFSSITITNFNSLGFRTNQLYKRYSVYVKV